MRVERLWRDLEASGRCSAADGDRFAARVFTAGGVRAGGCRRGRERAMRRDARFAALVTGGLAFVDRLWLGWTDDYVKAGDHAKIERDAVTCCDRV